LLSFHFAGPVVRLVDGRTPWEGRVEVKQDNEWFSLCATKVTAVTTMTVKGLIINHVYEECTDVFTHPKLPHGRSLDSPPVVVQNWVVP
jgi:hypothetical protein